MLKIYINGEEVVCDKQLEIKEEMLSTSSCILNNCYPKSWENTKDYTSQYYYPKDYSKCLIYNDDNLNSEEFFQLMKSGYEEMSEINLQISDEFDISQDSYKFKYDTFNEYEKWLCGV